MAVYTRYDDSESQKTQERYFDESRKRNEEIAKEQEKFSKNTDNTLNENLTKETKEVKTSNDDWYNNNLYESLKKRWTK